MSAANILPRLERVKQTGSGRWLGSCPAHEDRSPSLSVRELDDGRVLIHCFGGCGVDAVLSALGLEMVDLFPERLPIDNHVTARAPRIPANDVLAALAHEVLIASCAAADMAAGVVLEESDRDRLGLASRRLSAAVEVCNGYR